MSWKGLAYLLRLILDVDSSWSLWFCEMEESNAEKHSSKHLNFVFDKKSIAGFGTTAD